MAEEMRYVVDQLHRENLARAKKAWKRAEVRLFLRDEEGTVQGGCFGSVSMGWIEILILWVAPEARGQGWGEKMMNQAEWLAQEHGAIGAMVQTTDFQARPFYERLGYEVFADWPDNPPGHVTYFLRKRWKV